MDHMQVLGNFGFKYQLDYNGRTYIFSFLSDMQKAWYERWMKQEELNAINSSEFLTEAERKERRNDFVREVQLGAFQFGGEYYQRYYATERGKIRFIMMMLTEHHPDIDEKDVVKMLREKSNEVQGILALVLAESSLEVAKVPVDVKQVKMDEVYNTLARPSIDGGLGLPIETIRHMTDRQKIQIFCQKKPAKTERNTADKSDYSPDEIEAIDARMRQLAGNL